MMQIAQVGQMTADVKDIDFSTLTHQDILGDKMYKRRRSVIMVTLENRIATEVDVQKLMEAGMNVARFRMPHQSSKDKIKLFDKIKRATAACCIKFGLTNWPLATLVDLKTRSIMTGILEAVMETIGAIERDRKLVITARYALGNSHFLAMARHKIMYSPRAVKKKASERIFIALAFGSGVKHLRSETFYVLPPQDVPYIVLQKDTHVELTTDVLYFDKCNARKIFVNNLDVATEVKIGMEISIDGDEIELVCTEIRDANTFKTVVTKSGRLKDISVVCFRDFKSSRPFFTQSDLAIIKFVTEHQVDGVVINHVDDAAGVKMIKKYIGKKIRRPIIFSGISTEGGMINIDEIIKESDGIIFSREYLPYTVPASYKFRLNNIQKWVTAKCQQAGKPLYLSGAVMQTAINDGVAPENEISDVSNAILDGISGFILRACENMDYTLDTVRLLDGICRIVEPYTCSRSSFFRLTDQYMLPVNAAEAGVVSCVALANQTNAQVIILPTVTGRTAKALLQIRPCCLILAVCTNVRVTRMLQMFKCMVPLLYSGEPMKFFHLTITARVNFAVEYAVKMDWLHYGDTYAVLKRATDGSSYCDMVSVLSVNISNKPMVECEGDDEPDESERPCLLIEEIRT